MGGHKAGEVAARLAVDTVLGFVTGAASGSDVSGGEWPFGFDPSLSNVGNRLRTAIQLAHMHILETAVTSDQYAGMGTTIVASMMDGDRLSVAHAGDSRLYVLAGDRLRQITHDDSWMASMLAQDPAADRGHYERHPMRNALTNVVGARRRADVHVIEETLSGGELLVLTTDGVHGVLDDERLEQVLLDGKRATCGRWPRNSWPPRSRAAATTTAPRWSRGMSAINHEAIEGPVVTNRI